MCVREVAMHNHGWGLPFLNERLPSADLEVPSYLSRIPEEAAA